MSVRAPWYYVALVPEGGKGELVDLTDRVLDFEYEDHEAKTDKLKLTVNNFDLSNFDDPVFRHGVLLHVSWGSGSDVAPLREVVVRSVKGGRVLTVEADDRAVEMDTEKKSRTFENVRRSDVVRQIAEENGFGDPDVEDTEELHEVINQANLTDAQMIRKMAHLEGFEFFVDFDGMHWHRRRVGQAPIRTLTYYAANPEAAGDILDFSVDNDVTRKPGRVRVKSRDPMNKTDVDATADNETDTDRDVLQPYSMAIDGETGQLTFQARVAHEQVVPSNVQSQQDAEVEAKAAFRKVQQVAVKMKVELRGAPSLLAKSVVEIDGMGKRLSGKYYVQSVKHSLSGQGGGYTCSAQLITDGFRSGYGSGGKSEGEVDVDAFVAKMVSELKLVADTTDPRLASAYRLLAKEVAAVAGKSGGARASAAKAAAERAAGVAQLARSLGLQDTAATRAAGALRRIIQVEEAKAKGNVNDKDAGDADAMVPVTKIDPETGKTFTEYVSKRGRSG